MENIQIVLISGGKGTRSLDPKVPKSLQKITHEKFLIDVQLEFLVRIPWEELCIVLGYEGKQVEEHLVRNNLLQENRQFRIIQEREPLGTLGAWLAAVEQSHSDYSVAILGDLLFSVDIYSCVKSLIDAKKDFGVVVHPNTHPFDSDLLYPSWQDKDTLFYFPKKQNSFKIPRNNSAVAGIYIAKTESLKQLGLVKGDISHDAIPKYLSQDSVISLLSADFCMDTGTPERLAAAQQQYGKGIVNRRSGNQKCAIFSDLDGTILNNVEKKNVSSKVEVSRLFAENLSEINSAGIPLIVISNQPGISKGFFDWKDLQEFTANVEYELLKFGAFVDGWYYCPHHPESGWDGEVAELKIMCTCRKPGNGLLIQASKDLGISLENSVFIGDSESDKTLAENNGLRFLSVKSVNGSPLENSTISVLEALRDYF